MKTLSDFIIEAAFKYGCELSLANKPTIQHQVLIEAANNYAEYRFIQGKGDMVLGHVAMDLHRARIAGWNDAIEAAVKILEELGFTASAELIGILNKNEDG